MYGYNVNKAQALSTAKRHKILDILIQNNVMRPYEIISHLEMLIRTRKNIKSMELIPHGVLFQMRMQLLNSGKMVFCGIKNLKM